MGNWNSADLAEETNDNGIAHLVLSDQVKQYILDAIESGQYSPGDRLVESQLARQLRISQAPVREAIRDLVSAGFLDREPHKGAVVRTLTDDDMREIYAVRAHLDALAAEQAAPHIATEHIQALTDLKDRMVIMAHAQDFASAARLDEQFHMLIVDLSGNKLLKRIYESLQVGQYIVVTMRRSAQALENLAGRHQAVIDALQTRDPAIARQAMMAHIEGLRPPG